MTEVPTWAWCALTYLLATGINALTEVIVTRMKLTFVRQVLDPPRSRDDPDRARKDLDAARKFIMPPAGARRLRPRIRHQG